jgi:hypothetical protein
MLNDTGRARTANSPDVSGKTGGLPEYGDASGEPAWATVPVAPLVARARNDAANASETRPLGQPTLDGSSLDAWCCTCDRPARAECERDGHRLWWVATGLLTRGLAALFDEEKRDRATLLGCAPVPKRSPSSAVAPRINDFRLHRAALERGSASQRRPIPRRESGNPPDRIARFSSISRGPGDAGGLLGPQRDLVGGWSVVPHERFSLASTEVR